MGTTKMKIDRSSITKVELSPLKSKHYATQLIVWVGGNGYDNDGIPFSVSITGMGTSPSVRELEKGYYIDEGLDHVESKEHLLIAESILEKLLT